MGYTENLEKGIDKLHEELQERDTRIRELEEVAEGMLFEVKRTISPELREKAEQVLKYDKG